jgi:hypothetical protein
MFKLKAIKLINKINRATVFLAIFSLLLSLLTYKLCNYIAVKYFFDKIIYQKSTVYGYGLDSQIALSKFGDRSKDVIALDSNNPNVLGLSDDKSFKIAIIGDSFVWGQGLENNQRFVTILNKKLSSIQPTKIISLAIPGWNILDFVDAYNKMKKNFSPDLIIFTVVTNDVFINKTDSDNPITKFCLSINNNHTPFYDFDMDTITKNNPGAASDVFLQARKQGWENPTNLCVLDTSLDILPMDKTIYLVAEDYVEWSETKLYKQHLLAKNKYIISSSLGKNIPEYSEYFDGPVFKLLRISPVEGHPNSIANKMFADILFNEITSNPKWNFSK